MTETLTDSAPVTDDLDLLDDSRRHARCVICTGEPGDLIGVPYTALCGVRAINLRTWNQPECLPPDACEACVAMWDLGCQTCGAR